MGAYGKHFLENFENLQVKLRVRNQKPWRSRISVISFLFFKYIKMMHGKLELHVKHKTQRLKTTILFYKFLTFKTYVNFKSESDFFS